MAAADGGMAGGTPSVPGAPREPAGDSPGHAGDQSQCQPRPWILRAGRGLRARQPISSPAPPHRTEESPDAIPDRGCAPRRHHHVRRRARAAGARRHPRACWPSRPSPCSPPGSPSLHTTEEESGLALTSPAAAVTLALVGRTLRLAPAADRSPPRWSAPCSAAWPRSASTTVSAGRSCGPSRPGSSPASSSPCWPCSPPGWSSRSTAASTPRGPPFRRCWPVRPSASVSRWRSTRPPCWAWPRPGSSRGRRPASPPASAIVASAIGAYAITLVTPPD